MCDVLIFYSKRSSAFLVTAWCLHYRDPVHSLSKVLKPQLEGQDLCLAGAWCNSSCGTLGVIKLRRNSSAASEFGMECGLTCSWQQRFLRPQYLWVTLHMSGSHFAFLGYIGTCWCSIGKFSSSRKIVPWLAQFEAARIFFPSVVFSQGCCLYTTRKPNTATQWQ